MFSKNGELTVLGVIALAIVIAASITVVELSILGGLAWLTGQ